MGEKRMIVNADDLGLTPGVTGGIIQANRAGIVTSTSALMNTEHIQQDLPRARQSCPRMGIGVHLVITEGRPLLPGSEVPSLVNGEGCFFELHHQPERIKALNPDEVKAEWRTQIEYFINFGFSPDHLDSHHHISYFNPDLFRVMLELADQYELPIRFPPPEFIKSLGPTNIRSWLNESHIQAPAACITSFYGEDGAVTLENMLDIITTLPTGTREVMCHPGFADRELIEGCSYSKPRELELEILTSSAVIKAARENAVSLVNFASPVLTKAFR